MLVLKVVLGLCLAISSLATELKFIKDLPNDQESVGVKMNFLFDLLERQDLRIETLEFAVSGLKKTVERQNAEIARLHRTIEEAKYPQRIEEKAVILRSCEEIRSADPEATSGVYWIDPDGVGSGDTPISVICDMTTGTTLIPHDSEAQIEVDHCLDPGCYSRSIVYNATMRQMVALTQMSRSCRQFFRFDCFSVPFELNGQTEAWWNDRNGDAQFYWAGDNDTVHTCQCGIEGSCVIPDVSCNCDTSAAADLSDQGYITKKETLPVTKLNFGRTLAPSSFGRHTLGQLECTGRAILDRMPESCQDLWEIGHTLNGFYDVKGDTEIRSVYCDFNKIPGDPGFETSIGSVDVKASPVFFHVQRNSPYTVANSTIPFEVEQMNVGGGMNLTSGVFTAPKSGIYFFSFIGLKEVMQVATQVSLYHNSNRISSAYGDNLNHFLTLSLISNLNLKTGDQVRLQLISGELYESGGHYNNFVGILLQEEISM